MKKTIRINSGDNNEASGPSGRAQNQPKGREARLQSALRENLKKRKSQMRALQKGKNNNGSN